MVGAGRGGNAAETLHNFRPFENDAEGGSYIERASRRFRSKPVCPVVPNQPSLVCFSVCVDTWSRYGIRLSGLRFRP